MTMRLRVPGAWITVILAVAVPALPVSAGLRAPVSLRQTNDTATRTDTGPAPTSAELDDFARAVVATGNIKRAARPGIMNAPTQADRTKLEHKTANAIKAAIRSNQLSVHRYLQIVAFVQAHPAAQKEVIGLLKQLPLPPPPPYQPPYQPSNP